MIHESASAGDALRALAGAISPVLASPSAWRRLVAAADAIPLSSGGGIEFRPGCPDRVDLAVRFLSTQDATRALVGQPLAPAGVFGSAISSLAGNWVAAAEAVPAPRMLWLELDLPEDAGPQPSVFVGPGNPPRGLPPDMPDDAEWDVIVALLKPGQSSANLTRLRRALPDGAWVGYAGVMRGGELRATVSGLTIDEIPILLRQLSWPGDYGALGSVLSVARAKGPRITIGFDLTEGIGPALGIELGPFAPDCWEGLLQAATVVAPIPEAARGALLAWPGVSIADASWPQRLRERAGCIVRRLNHLKFGVDQGVEPRLKAYLYFGLLA